MGYKSKNKQGDVKPLPGSEPTQKAGGRKRARNYGKSEQKGLKAKGPGAKSVKERVQREQVKQKQRVKAVDVVDEDSDVEEALKPGSVDVEAGAREVS